MSRYTKRPSAEQKRKRALFVVGVVAALVALFFLSFWVTSLVLKSGQNNLIPQQPGIEDPSPTPKPSYKDLEKMVIEKDEEIRELKKELAELRGEEVEDESPTAKPTASPKPSESPSETTEAPRASKTPSPSKTASPTKAPTQKPEPTKAPTQAPTKAPTPAPTQAPTAPPITILPPAAG